MNRKWFGLLFLLLAYGALFLHQEHLVQERPLELPLPIAAMVQKTALGYLRQLGGETLFIRASVFLGGLKPGRNPYDYAEPLAHHLDAAAELHPPFLDTYFLCEATLPDIGPEYTLEANRILLKAGTAMPDNVLWPFFIGFNNYFHLNEPGEAAKYLKIAAEKPGAPGWLGHLASTLAAKGGDIRTGLLWLQGMVATEKDETQRERYQKSLTVFEQAAAFQEHIAAFTRRYGQPPPSLEALVPEFIAAIPRFEGYELSYTPPDLRLLRPHLEEQLRQHKPYPKRSDDSGGAERPVKGYPG